MKGEKKSGNSTDSTSPGMLDVPGERWAQVNQSKRLTCPPVKLDTEKYCIHLLHSILEERQSRLNVYSSHSAISL